MPAEFQTTRRVEFADVDQAGIVHFSRFFIYMETAEHEFLQSIGTSVHTKWKGKEIGWPRLTACCEYLQPAKFEDVLDIHIKVLRKGRSSMTYEFIFQKDKSTVARGQMSSVCCIVDSKKGLKAIPIPPFIAEQLQISSPEKRKKRR